MYLFILIIVEINFFQETACIVIHVFVAGLIFQLLLLNKNKPKRDRIVTMHFIELNDIGFNNKIIIIAIN